MKRYRFSLQKVLDYNTHLQKSEAEVMSRLQAELRAIDEKCASLENAYKTACVRFQESCAIGQTAGQAAATGVYLKDLTREIEKCRAEFHRQADRVEAQRKRLLAVTQDKEVIEKLRVRARAAYLEQERKSEEQFIEEFLANRTAQAKS